jgi:hypothetical protein
LGGERSIEDVMHPPLVTQRTALPEGSGDSCLEGRDCELSRQLTALLLFPHLDARPGGWMLLVAAACTYVAVRALELSPLF